MPFSNYSVLPGWTIPRQIIYDFAFVFTTLFITCGAPPASGANFAAVLPRYGGPQMALMIQGEIVAGDARRMVAALDTVEGHYTDHRLRAVVLDSVGGLVGEAEQMARAIRSRGLVTAVPDGAQCMSSCVLLFAAGSRKIASDGAFMGVHGVADGNGEQSDGALAITTELAKIYAAYGVPASVIGRMVVTPPEAIAYLTGEEIKMFPWGTVMPRLQSDEVPYALAGLDFQLRQFDPPRVAYEYQKAGPALPTPVPPPDTFISAPPHTPELVREATDFSTGYAYGESIGDGANCNRSGGYWHSGCLAGSYEREKFDPPAGCVARANRNPDPRLAAFGREMCQGAAPASREKPSVATYVGAWLAAYDRAYTTKARGGDCGNGASPDNDGCRAGAAAWPRTESER